MHRCMSTTRSLSAPVSKDDGGLMLRDAPQRGACEWAWSELRPLRRSSDCMSLPLKRRLTLDAVARVTRMVRAEPQARRVSHERS